MNKEESDVENICEGEHDGTIIQTGGKTKGGKTRNRITGKTNGIVIQTGTIGDVNFGTSIY